MADEEEQPKDPGLLARRLQHLYDTVYPPGSSRPYSDQRVADALNKAAGKKITGRTYLWQMRKGLADNPTYQLVTGLARLFGVSPAYFFPEEEIGRGELPPEAVAVLQDERVLDLALRASGLSDQSLRAIRQMIDSARAIEGKG